VLWVALGVIVRLGGEIELYPVYLFSGMILLNFFIEAFSNGTRSLVDNSELIKKIYLPRELFPIASTIVAIVNFLPQVLVLLIVTLFLGWEPMWQTPIAFVLAVVIVSVLATGLAMLFGSINVSFRDAQNFVDLITMTALWASPVLYSMTLVSDPAPDWLLVLYQLNPVTPAVELMHLAFWVPVTEDPTAYTGMFGLFTAIALFTSIVVLFFGQLVFRRLEGRFAQDL
jgi:ABC-2 type transport system permease protein